MAFWLDLMFGNWIGLSSMLTLIFMIGMGIYFTWLFVTKSKEPPAE